MTKESDKSMKRRKSKFEKYKNIFYGKGIDIGSGDCVSSMDGFPRVEKIEPFDINDGNANYISKYRNVNSYDFVISSHCLEHMVDPMQAIKEWFSLIKEDGHMIITVPDEDMYEHGIFPSLFNHDHKWTFTIYKKNSIHERSINLLNLLTCLDNCKLISAEIIDDNFDYNSRSDQTLGSAECCIEVIIKKETKKYSIIRHNALGDVILTTPIVRYLKSKEPNCQIYFHTAFHSNVYDNNPYIHKYGNIPIPFGSKVIELGGCYESNLGPHIIDSYFKKIGVDNPTEEMRKLEIFPSESDDEYVDKWVNENKCGNYCVIHLRNSWSNIEISTINKCISHIHSLGINIIYVGNDGGDLVGDLSIPSTNLIGCGWSIQKIYCLIKRAKMFFGLDSGITHLAGATDTPIVVLYSWQTKENRAPRTKGVYCFSGKCPIHDSCYKVNGNSGTFFTHTKCSQEKQYSCRDIDVVEVNKKISEILISN